MSSPVIRVSGLSKQYRIGAGGPQKTFREVVAGAVGAPIRRARAILRGEAAGGPTETFWALKDVSFEVARGEVVGIIGRNGAGKSTLLKILSRIAEPTAGEIRMRGRLGALLEVGTGFHPELTGRDNVYLNGALLGMRRAEIQRKFSEIVEFAEVEKFIDTPVKHYSSGMYVRLAFAVAAHLEPEVLVVDEVLAVGDSEFQKKCLGKMGDIAHGGRTVLFVSHNATAIRNLCTRVVLLRAGELIANGEPNAVLTGYERESRGVRVTAETAVRDDKYRRGSGEVRFTAIEVRDATGNPRHEFEPGETIQFALTYECWSDVSRLSVSVLLRFGQTGEAVTSVQAELVAGRLSAGQTGSCVVVFPDNSLRPGEYPLYFWLGKSSLHPYDVVDGLTDPLTIYSRRSAQELGYDPQNPSGVVTVPFRIQTGRDVMWM